MGERPFVEPDPAGCSEGGRGATPAFILALVYGSIGAGFAYGFAGGAGLLLLDREPKRARRLDESSSSPDFLNKPIADCQVGVGIEGVSEEIADSTKSEKDNGSVHNSQNEKG